MIKPLLLTIGIISMTMAATASAERTTYNFMSPRQVSVAAMQKDYSYGFSILPGRAVDTLEAPNRSVGWNFNYLVLDKYVLRPVAHAYAELPRPVQTGVGNFFSNLSDLNSTVNHLFLGEVKDSGVSLLRFIINSSIGLGGIFDVAGVMGLSASPLEMSTVMGRAGVDQGPYLMIPAYGPTTARDLHGDAFDNAPYYFLPWYVGLASWAVEGIHNRAQLIDQEAVVDNALDPYIQTRDFYLMYAQGKVDPEAKSGAGTNQDQNQDQLDAKYLDEID